MKNKTQQKLNRTVSITEETDKKIDILKIKLNLSRYEVVAKGIELLEKAED